MQETSNMTNIPKPLYSSALQPALPTSMSPTFVFHKPGGFGEHGEQRTSTPADGKRDEVAELKAMLTSLMTEVKEAGLPVE